MNKKTPNLRLLDKTEEKDHTRKPVIRDPLPEKDQITLCELVTWRAIGKAWPARRLKGLMKRNRGQRKPAFLWESFEREAATVVSLCGKGDLSPAGSVDGNPRQPFSEGYFLSDVYADFVSDSIGFDLLAWPSAQPYPDENPEEPKELPTYYGVQFFRSDLLSTFEPAAETDQAPAWGTQDDAAPAPKMVSARETDRLKPATSAVPPLDSVNLSLDDTLSLKEIFNLTMGNDPKAAIPADSREYDAISRAARQGRLKATKDGRRPRFWLVYKDDLGQFLSTADKHWAWLRQFYKRWMSARGEEPLAPSITAADDIDQRARQEETADTAPKRRRPRKTTIEDEAKIESKIRTVLEIAVRKWRNTENAPGFRRMARLLIEQEPEVRRLYKEEPVRKILDGTYAASKSRSIPGYVGYSGH